MPWKSPGENGSRPGSKGLRTNHTRSDNREMQGHLPATHVNRDNVDIHVFCRSAHDKRRMQHPVTLRLRTKVQPIPRTRVAGVQPQTSRCD